MASDEELVGQLEQVWASMAALADVLDEEEWRLPTECPGWSVQDHLVHITGIEWMLLGRPAPEYELAAYPEHVKNDVGRANERFVDSRRSWAGPEALAEFLEVTADRLTQLRTFTADDFGAASWTPVGPGTVRDLLPFRVFDSWVHEQIITPFDDRLTGGEAEDVARMEPSGTEHMVSTGVAAQAVVTAPRPVREAWGEPDGTTVVFSRTAPLAGTTALAVTDGRARALDRAPADPTVQILLDGETFARLACGRLDPAATIASGAVHFHGDAQLGRRVVEEMNFLF